MKGGENVKIYIIMEHDDDPYCGSHFVAAYDSKQKAVDHIDKRCKDEDTDWYREAWYIIEPDLN